MIRFVLAKGIDTVFLSGHFDRWSTDLPILFKCSVTVIAWLLHEPLCSIVVLLLTLCVHIGVNYQLLVHITFLSYIGEYIIGDLVIKGRQIQVFKLMYQRKIASPPRTLSKLMKIASMVVSASRRRISHLKKITSALKSNDKIRSAPFMLQSLQLKIG